MFVFRLLDLDFCSIPWQKMTQENMNVRPILRKVPWWLRQSSTSDLQNVSANPEDAPGVVIIVDTMLMPQAKESKNTIILSLETGSPRAKSIPSSLFKEHESNRLTRDFQLFSRAQWLTKKISESKVFLILCHIILHFLKALPKAAFNFCFN